MKKVLIIDDNKDLHIVLEGLMSQNRNIQFHHAYNGMEGYQKLLQLEPDLTILDNQMPVMSGFQLLEKLKRENRSYVIIMLTAFGQISDAVNAMKMGALDYLTKPFDDDQFNVVINKALKIGSLKNSKIESIQALLPIQTNLIGESKLFKQVLEHARLVATTDINVIINGNNGTGKEEIAKYIHNNSERKDQPFITVDCGAIPETLFEREMFGCVKGAFTGAESDTIGYFEAANNGTIFLDEVGNLPYKSQSSLLRVLQNRKFKRVGDIKEVEIDVRLISATNATLLDEICENRFREDLFHRINGFDITLPDLKDRKEDIPLLANHFVAKYNAKFKRNVQQITPEAMEILKNHHWSGNVRELINTIQKAVLVCTEITLRPQHIQLLSATDKRDFKHESSLIEEIMEQPISMNKKMDLFEKEIIRQAVEANNGNKSLAAKWLKISRKTLYDKLKKLGLS